MLQTLRARLILATGATLLAFSLPLLASAANVILNPGFETGSVNSAANWSAVSFKPNGAGDHNAQFVRSADAHSGVRSGRVTITSYTAGDAKWVPDPVAVSAGQFYTVSFWYKSSTSTSAFVAYNGDFSCCWVADLPAAADWTKYETTVLIPTGKTSFQMYLSLNSVGTLRTDDYFMESAIAPVFTQGHVTLTFDDGWQTFKDNAAPVLDVNGLKATLYAVSGVDGNNIGGTPNTGFMSTEDILALQAAGYEIGAHTRNHLDLVNQIPAAAGYADQNALWQGEIVGSRSDLMGAGFTPVSTFAYPYGQYNATVKAQVQAAGFTSARSVDQGFNFTNSDRYALKIMPINNQSTAAGINALIDQAVASKTWLILMFHHVQAGTEAQGSLNALCVEPVLDANGVPVVPEQTQPDFDCTTTSVLEGIAAHIASQPAGTGVTMGQGIAAMDAANHLIDASAGPNGSISPSGSVPVLDGATQAFTLSPNAGYMLDTLLVDGVAAATTSLNTYTFENVTVDHTIAVTYVAVPVNTAPVTTDQPSLSTTKNTALEITLTATDAEMNPLAFATTTSPLNGNLSLIGGDGKVTYTPNADFVGTDTFTFKANDGALDGNIATATIAVIEPPATPPPPPTPAPPPPPVSSGGGGSSNGPVAGSFGGGGGGGGAGFYFTPAPSANAAGNAGAGTPPGQVLGASTFRFLNDLSKGMRNGDVLELQKRLVAEGHMTIDVPTNYFGSMTEAAVKAYQSKHGVDSVGRVGPKTRAVLNGSLISVSGSAVPTVSDEAKATLIVMLKEQLKVLMDKIAALMGSTGSTSTTASSTPETTASSTVSTTSTTTSTQ